MPLLRDLTPGTFFRFTNGRDGVMVKLALPCQYAHTLHGGAYDPRWIADASVRNGGTDFVVTFPTYAAARGSRLRYVRPFDPQALLGALYCLERDYPLPLAAALLGLVDESTSLTEAHDVFESFDVRDHAGCHVIDETFDEAVEGVAGRSVSTCEKCDDVMWSDDATDAGGDIVCETCLERHYTQCHGCDDYARDTYDVFYADDLPWCESCYRDLPYCEQCGGRFYNSDHDHEEESCDCEAPHRRFAFPANGAGTIAQDERLTVELPAGTIDEVGMQAIHEAVFRAMDADNAPSWVIRDVLEEVGPLWQSKRGNFTRRLSSALYKACKDHSYYPLGSADPVKGWKMPEALVSEVGNLARAHSSTGAVWRVEVTRDLNQSPEAFGNEGSCWWSRNGDYSRSRCSLKAAGGLGLRSYREGARSDNPSGRAWVQPVKLDDDGSLVPTHDALGAVGYVVYNGYGYLAQYAPARILAHLAGKTYRKIAVNIETQYVNSNTGYLVADEVICNRTDAVDWSTDDEHESYDGGTFHYTPTTTTEVAA